jgi:hypothetical protein
MADGIFIVVITVQAANTPFFRTATHYGITNSVKPVQQAKACRPI